MPALVMGFGGTGAHILTALKELTVLKHGSVPESINFLLFDTIADWRPDKAIKLLGGAAEEHLSVGAFQSTSLDPATEYFYLGDKDPDLKQHVYNYLSPAGNPENYPHLKDWLHAAWLSQHIVERTLSIAEGAAQQRQIGRFAMFQSAEKIIRRIASCLKFLRSHFSSPPSVWIVASSAGGTGGGCFIDAAYMVRLAAVTQDFMLNGIVILPDVYEGVPGVSLARASSLFRELDRVQECDIPPTDRYVEKGCVVSSKVSYDSHQQYSSIVQGRLFDNLFYVGKECVDQASRRSFFISVANAIDVHLDATAGPVLLEASVNETASVSSFGAARLHVPMKTYVDLFAWEQVVDYLNGIAAPPKHGPTADRIAAAEQRLKRLSPLFSVLMDRLQTREDANEEYIKLEVDARKIVTEWYMLRDTSSAGDDLTVNELQTILLVYINPYFSSSEPDPAKVESKNLTVKTYKENKAVLGNKIRESQDYSRDRFVEELENITGRYTSTVPGEATFERGRRLVLEKTSKRLRKRIDDSIIEELIQDAVFDFAEAKPDEGTRLTRLFAEIRHILAGDGPLQRIENLVAKFLATLISEEPLRIHQRVEALRQLRCSGRPHLLAITWVESYQQIARDNLSDYIGWYQKQALLKDMQQVVRSVRERFQEWENVIGSMLNGLALRAEQSALFSAQRELRHLEDRLSYTERHQNVLHSPALVPDEGRRGYREELCKSISDKRWLIRTDPALADSRWAVGLSSDGTPWLKLVMGTNKSYASAEVPSLSQDLHDIFKHEIERQLTSRGIFDYLQYLRQNHYVDPEVIAWTLNNAASVLTNSYSGNEECRLIYQDPRDPQESDLAHLINHKLTRFNVATKDPVQTYSDPHSLILLKVRKPYQDRVIELEECRNRYQRWQEEDLNGDLNHDHTVYRTQVYHIFPHELEAWYVERHYIQQRQQTISGKHLPPRVVRLLENPAMMQGFIHCIATGAIEKRSRREWVWHNTAKGQDVVLTDEDEYYDDDLVRAAVVFVLQQREGKRGGLIPIILDDVRQSCIDMAKKSGKSIEAMLSDFIGRSDKETALSSFSLGAYGTAATGKVAGNGAQIFLSYAREDKEKVQELYRRLSEAGFNPWMDVADILPGEMWETSIKKAIRDSDFFLVCLSSNSVNKRGFLQTEIKDALNIWQEMLVDDIYVIPVRLENCELPESLQAFQSMSLLDEDSWPRLLKALKKKRRGAESPVKSDPPSITLDRLLDEHLTSSAHGKENSQLKAALRMIFEFYSDPNIKVGLRHRLL
jgi:hypothetical protein